MDVTRGVALLGITLVNVYMFALPFGVFMVHGQDHRQGLLNEFAFWVMQTMCAGRFYPLFSLMFGIGMMMILMGFMRRESALGGQAGSNEHADLSGQLKPPRGFAWAFLRRLVVLGLIGIFHFTFIWYGDIVFFYACVGLILLLTPMFTARMLLILAGAAYGIGVLLLSGLTLLQATFGGGIPEAQTAAVLPEAMQALPPAERLIEALTQQKIPGGPEHPIWMGIETEVFSQGPMSQAIIFRLIMYAFGLIFMIVGMLGTVIAMFLTGAAMVRINFFASNYRRWHKGLAIFGYGGGLLISLLAMTIDQIMGWDAQWLSTFASMIVGPWMAIGLLCVFLLAVPYATEHGSRAVRGFIEAIGRMGRMGLTNYITMSILATFITNWWGLGLYGKLSLFEMMLMAIGLWIVLLVASNIWLRFFKLGPLEWIWKSATYWKAGGHRPVA